LADTDKTKHNYN